MFYDTVATSGLKYWRGGNIKKERKKKKSRNTTNNTPTVRREEESNISVHPFVFVSVLSLSSLRFARAQRCVHVQTVSGFYLISIHSLGGGG